MANAAAASASAVTVSSLSLSDAELWLNHLVASFAAKATPRSYFHRHLVSDPHLDYAGIIVVHTPTQRCVSSVRVFLRAIYVDGQRAMIGGIGEVSTQPAWRGNGYAELCLKRCCEYMAAMGVPLSSLHTSNAVAYYNKLGWLPVERLHALLDVSHAAAPAEMTAMLRLSALAPHELVPSPLLASISSVYASYASHFDGPVSRSMPYWCRWVRAEHEARMATAAPIIAITAHAASSSSHSSLVGYLFLQRLSTPLTVTGQDGHVSIAQHDLVREFACADVARQADGGRAVFLALLASARHDLPRASHSPSTLTRIAAPIARLFRPALPAPYTHHDTGFMYRPIACSPMIAASSSALSASAGRAGPTVQREGWGECSALSGDELLARLQHDAANKHVFFATDAF